MDKHRNAHSFRLQPIVLGLHLAFAGAVMAAPGPNELPTGGQVTYGSATISQPGAAQLQINQATQQATLNWNTFNIGAAAQVEFKQPNASAVALNRVVQDNASVIEGRLTANGQVFLVNPSGVLFGKNAQVDVGGMVATTMKISDADFQRGNYQFARDGATGEVVNQGQIRAANGGYVALVGATVRNEGTIQANHGTVALAAGDGARLEFGDGKLVNVQVDAATIKTLVENKQLIQAEGGRVLMTAVAASKLQGAVINNAGAIEANSLTSVGGVVRLEGADEIHNGGTLDASGATAGGVVQLAADSSGQASSAIHQSGVIKASATAGGGGNISLSASGGIDNSGRLDASGTTAGGNVSLALDGTGTGAVGGAPGPLVRQGGSIHADAANGKGGKVVLTGDYLQLDNASLTTATGSVGGGAIYAGGGKQGKDPSIHNAKSTRVEQGATLDASATDTGDGGIIVAWGDDASRAYGSFSAKGGPNGGDGGLVETSGHWLDVNGIKVETGAPEGKGGEWLLDPWSVTIDDTLTEGDGKFTNNLNTYTWTATGPNSYINSSSINTFLDFANNNNVTITTASGNPISDETTGSITVNTSILRSAGGNANVPTLKLIADAAITLGANVSIAGNALNQLNIELDSGHTDLTNSDITLSGGSSLVSGGGSISLSTGYVSANSTGTSVSGKIDLQGATIDARGGSGGIITMNTWSSNTGTGGDASINLAAGSFLYSGGQRINLTTHPAGDTSSSSKITNGGTIDSGGGVINLTTHSGNTNDSAAIENNGAIYSRGAAINLFTNSGSNGSLAAISNNTATAIIDSRDAGGAGQAITLNTNAGSNSDGTITTQADSKILSGGGRVTLSTSAAGAGSAVISHTGGIDSGLGNILLETAPTTGQGSISTFSGSSLTTNGGAITLTSDRLNASQKGAILLTGNLISGGGNITIGGGAAGGYADATKDTGNSAFKTGPQALTINAGDGKISILGKATAGAAPAVQFNGNDTQLLTTGAGTITISGINTTNGKGLSPSGKTLISSAAGAISLTGDSPTGGIFVAAGSTAAVSITSVSGDITLTGKATAGPGISFGGTGQVIIQTDSSTANGGLGGTPTGSILLDATGSTAGINFAASTAVANSPSRIQTNRLNAGAGPGNITLNAGAGALTYHGAVSAGTSTVVTPGTVQLLSNVGVNLFGNSTSLTGGITTNNQAIAVHAANNSGAVGALALNDTTITSTSGNVLLDGVGVSGGTTSSVNSGTGTIIIDGKGAAGSYGAVNYLGSLTSTHNPLAANKFTDPAITIRHAGNTTLGNITATAANASVMLGDSGGNNISGVVSQNGGSVINATYLIGNTTNSVTLGNDNVITNLATFTTAGDFILKDTYSGTGGLHIIGAVKDGTNHSVSLNSTHGMSEDSGGSITSANLVLLGTGDGTHPFSLNQAGNHVGTLAASTTGGAVTFRDDDALIIGQVTANSVTTNGINTGDQNLDLISLADISQAATNSAIVTTGTLSGSAGTSAILNNASNAVANLGAFTTTNGSFYLSDSVALGLTGTVTVGGAGNTATFASSAGGVTESGTGGVSATGLVLRGTGPFSFTTAANNTVGTLAASTSGGAITYDDHDALIVGTLTDTTGTLNGIASTNQNVTLQTGTASDLTINQDLNAGSGNVSLVAAGGISQAHADATGKITTTGTLSGSAGTSAILNNASNAVANLGAFTTTNGSFYLSDSVALGLTGTVTVGGAGNTATFASSAGGVTESLTGGLSAAGLLLRGTGPFSFTTAANNTVGTLVASTSGGAITYEDNDALIVGTLTDTTGTLNGIASTNQNVTLQTGTASDLTINQDLNAGSGDVSLAAAGGISQAHADATGKITTTGTLSGSAGTSAILNNASNAVANLGAFTTTNGSFYLSDSVALSLTGTVGVGGVGNTATFASSAGGVSESGTGGVSATGLLLRGIGPFSFTTAANNTVGTLAASTSGGAITYEDHDALIVGTLADTTGTLNGIASTNQNVTLQTGTASDLTINQDVNAGSGDVSLVAAGGISQANADATGKITTTGTLSGSAGNSASAILNNASNAVANLSTFTAGNGFTLIDASGGLNVTGTVAGGTGPTLITTAGGALALNSNNVSGNQVTLNGIGINSTGGTVNAGNGNLTLNAGGDAISLGGDLTTTGIATISLLSATTVALNGVVSAINGTLEIGQLGNITGNVTQTGTITAINLIGSTGINSNVNLGGSNHITNIGNSGFTAGSGFTLNDADGGLTLNGAVSGGTGATSITTAGGHLTLGAWNVDGAGVTLQGAGVSNAVGSTVTSDAGNILINGGTGVISLLGNLSVINGDNSLSVTLRNASTVTLGGNIQAAPTTLVIGINGDITGAVNQQNPSSIHVNILTGHTAGSVNLSQPNNVISELAAFTTNGPFQLIDSSSLTVTGAVTTSTNGAASITADSGLTVANTGSVTGVGVNLTNNTGNSIAINGLVAAGTGNVVLNSAGGVTEAASGAVTGVGLLLRGTGAFDLLTNGANNNVATLAADTSGGAVSYRDSNALEIGTVGSTDGITSHNQNVAVEAAGNLTLTKNVNSVVNTDANPVSLTTTGIGNIIGNGGKIYTQDTQAGLTLDAGGGIGIGGAVLTNTGVLTPLNLTSHGSTSVGLPRAGNIILTEDNSLSTDRVHVATIGASATNRNSIKLTTLAGNTWTINGAYGDTINYWTLSAPNSSIVNGLGGLVSAYTLTLDAGVAIGASGNPITTATPFINATSNQSVLGGATGGIWLSNNQATTLTALSNTVNGASGPIDVENTAGLLTVGDVSDDTLPTPIVTPGRVTSSLNTVYLHNQTAGITLNGIVTGSSATDAVTISTGTVFTNNAGANAVVANGGGRWIVFSNRPQDDTFGGLQSLQGLVLQNALWNSTYPNIPPAGSVSTGNRYMFAYQPTVTLTPSNLTKTYGQDYTTNVANDVITPAGFYGGIGAGTAFAQDTLANAFTGTLGTTTSLGSPANANVKPGVFPLNAYDINIDTGTFASTNGNNLTPVVGHLTINGAAATLAALKTYDGGNTFANAQITVTGVTIGGNTETLTLSGIGPAVANSPNAYDNTTNYLSGMGGMTLADGTGSNAGLASNYVLPSLTVRSANNTADINAATATLAALKTYDGSSNFTNPQITVTGVNGQTLGLTGAGPAVANSPNVYDNATNYLGSLGGMALANGTGDIRNYVLPSLTVRSANNTADINAATATLVALKTYDGSSNFTNPQITVTGVNGQTLGLTGVGPAVANSPNVYDNATNYLGSLGGMTLANGTGDIRNYVLPSLTVRSANNTADINAATATLVALKTYDGSSNFTNPQITVTGVNGQTLGLTGVGPAVANSPNVYDNATNYLGSLGGMTLANGTGDIRNYVLPSLTVRSANNTADINAATATLVALKTYDGSSNFTNPQITVTGVNGQTLGLTGVGPAVADSPNVYDNATNYLGSLGGMTLANGTGDIRNYVLPSLTVRSANNTADINAATATLVALKTYDGSSNFTNPQITVTGVNGQTLGLTGVGPAVANSPNVYDNATNYLGSLGGMTLANGTGDIRNYVLPSLTVRSANNTADINAATATLVALKTYDGSSNFTNPQITVTGVNGQTLGLTGVGPAVANSPNVYDNATNYLGSLGGMTLANGTGDIRNYVLPSLTVRGANNTADINAATATLVALKTYDGSSNFTNPQITVTGVNGQTLGLTGVGPAVANSPNVYDNATNYLGSLGGMTLANGTGDIRNYVLPSLTVRSANNTADINAATATLVALKTYDGSSNFTNPQITVTGVNGQTLGLTGVGPAVANSPNVYDNATNYLGSLGGMTLANGTGDIRNYVLPSLTVRSANNTADINAATATLVALKTYDGSSNFTNPQITVTGVNGQTLGLTGVGPAVANSPNVYDNATNYLGSLGGMTLANGTGDIRNYVLPSLTVRSANNTADINAATATLVALKTYDGSSNFTNPQITVTGVNGQTLGLTGVGPAVANSPNVYDNATNYLGSLGGMTLANGTGDIRNYVLPSLTVRSANNTADINAATATLVALKTYDGSSNFTNPQITVTGVNGQTLGLTGVGPAVANSPNVYDNATNYLGSLGGMTLANGTGDIRNYVLPSLTVRSANNTADINAATATLAALKTYDGSSNFTNPQITVTGVNGQTLGLTGVGPAVANSPNVYDNATNYLGSLGGMTLANGTGDIRNYVLPSLTVRSANNTADINAATATLVALKTYDGSSNFTNPQITVTGVNGQTLGLTGVGPAVANSPNVYDNATNYLGSLGGMTLANGTGDIRNYVLPSLTVRSANNTADINAATATLVALKTYDGSSNFTNPQITVTGVNGQTLGLTGVGPAVANSPNVYDNATNYLGSLGGMTLANGTGDIRNYVLPSLTVRSANNTADINAATATLVALKTYDGSSNFTNPQITVTGVNGQTLGLTGVGPAVANSPNVYDNATNYLGSLGGMTLANGTGDIRNYVLPSLTVRGANNTADINAATATLVALKTYDGSSNFTNPQITVTGVNGQTLGLTGVGPAVANSPNVYDNATNYLGSLGGMTLANGTGDIRNYVLPSLTVRSANNTADINAATATLVALKTYDGSSNFTNPQITVTGVNGQTLGLTGVGPAVANSPNVYDNATNYLGSLGGMTLANGTGDIRNYVLPSLTVRSANNTADINAATATLVALKTYDGSSNFTNPQITVTGVNGQTLGLTGVGPAVANSPNVYDNATNYLGSLGGMTLANGTGDIRNYVLPSLTVRGANNTADINAATATLVALKTYDGSSNFTNPQITVTGVNGQTLGLTGVGPAVANSPNVYDNATNYLGSLGGMTLANGTGDIRNYVLPSLTVRGANNTADINAATATLVALKTYDGSSNFTNPQITVTGVNGQTLGLTGVGPAVANSPNVYDNATNYLGSLGGMTLANGTGDIRNYVLPSLTVRGANNTADINAATATLVALKTYDGSSNFTNPQITVTGVNGQTLGLTGAGPAVANSPNVYDNATNYLGSLGGMTLANGTGDIRNYVLPSLTVRSANNTADINAATATLVALKTYDGSSNFTNPQITVTGVNGQTLGLTGVGPAVANSPNVYDNATNYLGSLGGMTLANGTGDIRNYVLPSLTVRSANNTADINAATATLVALKTYDGSSNFTNPQITVTGVNGQTLGLTGVGPAVANSPNVYDNATNYLGSLGGMTLANGTGDIRNYVLPSLTVRSANNTADINAATATLVALKTYDGSSNFTNPQITVTGVNGQTLGLTGVGPAVANSPNVYDNATNYLGSLGGMTLANGTGDIRNYVLPSLTVRGANNTADINAATATLVALKTYDGSSNFTNPQITVTGVNGQTLGLTGVGPAVANSPNVYDNATNYLGSLGGMTLANGTGDIRNYVLPSLTVRSANNTADINAATATLVALKTYDGSSNFTNPQITVTGVNGQTLGLTGVGPAVANSPNVYDNATNYLGSLGGMTLANGTGDIRNYVLPSLTVRGANNTADINAATATLVALKTYDGSSNFTNPQITVTGVNGQTLGLTGVGPAVANSPNVYDNATNYLGSLGGMTLANGTGDIRNYVLPSLTVRGANNTADINAATATLVALKTYDGSSNFTNPQITVTGVNGQTLGLTGVGPAVANSPNVYDNATNYLGSLGGMTLANGTGDIRNYVLPSLTVRGANNTADINAATATLVALKTYDGSSNFTNPQITVTGVNGQTLGLTGVGPAVANSPNVYDNATNYLGSLGGMTLANGTGDIRNYVLPSLTVRSANNTADINAATATLVALKTYDGSSNFTNPQITVTGVNGQTLGLTGVGPAVANSPNVYDNATNYLGSLGGMTLANGTGDIRNYVLPSLTVRSANNTADINAATATLAALKTYDGSSNFTNPQITVTGVNGQTLGLTGAGPAVANSPNVYDNATNYLGSLGGMTLANGTGDIRNYVLPSLTVRSANNTADINAATATLVALKTYDGSSNFTNPQITVTGVNGQTLGLTGVGPAVANSPNVYDNATNYLGSLGGMTLANGTGDIRNYVLPSLTVRSANNTADINAATATLVALKTYDGSSNFTNPQITVTGVNGQTLGLTGVGPAVANSPNVYDNATNYLGSLGGMTLANGTGDIRNYVLPSLTVRSANNTADINARPVDITATRVYNGLTSVNGDLFTINNKVPGDMVTLTGGSAIADSKNVGKYTLGSPSPHGLSTYTLLVGGGEGSNYTLTGATGWAIITPAPLTLAAVSDIKTYDGTPNSNLPINTTGLVPGDTISFPGLQQLFDSKNAGPRILNVNPNYTVNDGNGGGNYSIILNNAPGLINPATLQVYATTDTKVYDGNTSSKAIPIYSGLFGGDSINSKDLFQRFNSPEVGDRTLNVEPGWVVNDGNQGNNYTLVFNNAPGKITAGGTTAEVEPKYGYRYAAVATSGVHPFTDSLSAANIVASNVLIATSTPTANPGVFGGALKAAAPAAIPLCPDVRRKIYQDEEVYLEDNKLKVCRRRNLGEESEENYLPLSSPIRPRAY